VCSATVDTCDGDQQSAFRHVFLEGLEENNSENSVPGGENPRNGRLVCCRGTSVRESRRRAC
jgi:hypothetical protein